MQTIYIMFIDLVDSDEDSSEGNGGGMIILSRPSCMGRGGVPSRVVKGHPCVLSLMISILITLDIWLSQWTSELRNESLIFTVPDTDTRYFLNWPIPIPIPIPKLKFQPIPIPIPIPHFFRNRYRYRYHEKTPILPIPIPIPILSAHL